MNRTLSSKDAWRDVVKSNLRAADPWDAIIVTMAFLGLLTVRVQIGQDAFVGVISLLATLMVARNARHLWQVLLFVSIYGAIFSVFAKQTNESDLAALAFIWCLSFVSSLAPLLPGTRAVVAVLNAWGLFSLNIPGTADHFKRGVIAWIAGAALAVVMVGMLQMTGRYHSKGNLRFTRASFSVDKKVRRLVASFAFWRATVITGAGVLGVLAFPHNKWLVAMTAAMVIGLDPVRSQLRAAQRGIGTVGGVTAGMLVIGEGRSTWIAVSLLFIFIFLTVLLKPVGELIFSLFLSATLVLAAGLIVEAPLRFATVRLVETLIGAATGVVAVHLLNDRLVQIAASLKEGQAATVAPE